MTRFLCVLLVGLSTSACEKNLKRCLENPQLPDAKRVRLQSYIDKDCYGNVQKMRIKLFFDSPQTNNPVTPAVIGNTYNLRSKSFKHVVEEPLHESDYARSLTVQENINKTIDLLMNEICAKSNVAGVRNIIVRMDGVLKRQEKSAHVSSQILETTIWYLAKKAIVHTIPKEHVLPFLFFYFKNDIDLFGIKNNENRTLIDYAVHENCHSLAQALLQFNSELAEKLHGKVTLITPENIAALKESADDKKLKTILSAQYVPRSGIKVFLHRMNLIKEDLVH